MKKRFLAVITGIIIILSSLSGCSCSSAQVLEFNHDFYGTETNTPTNDYKEVCEYNVTLDSSNVKESIKDKLPEISGSLVTTLEISSTTKGKLNNILKDTPSNLLEGADDQRGMEIYYFATEFNVSVKHSSIVDDKEFKDDAKTIPNPNYNPQGINYDSIKTEVYFFSHGGAYAPIYTTTTFNYTSFAIAEEGSASVVTYGKCSTLYQKDKYTLTEIYTNNLEDLDKQENVINRTINYTFKTLVDNAQLLFIARNMNVNKDSNFLLPTVSYQYGDAKDLTFTHLGLSSTGPDFSVDYNLNQNSTTCDKSALKVISFRINSQYNSGVVQNFTIQERETTQTESSLPFKSLLYKYEKPLLEYSSNSSLGVLCHELTKVDITEKN